MDLISIPGPKDKSEFVDKSEHKILVTWEPQKIAYGDYGVNWLAV